ncbi:MAG: hypothetical protein E7Z85_02455 [Methanosphaera stadtmanae]|nr:hypothetical protein [Methanosphaera stadtmanae]
MNLNLIKILGLLLVTMCCIIATYTDVKRQIIPNWLTFSSFLMGISIVTIYFYQLNNFNVFYYSSIIIVYSFSYALWYFGVWAGGDVKLFTAISTLLIPEFFDVIPSFYIFNMQLPFKLVSFKIPTFLLIFNSVLAIIPLVICMVVVKIFTDKRNLIGDLIETFDFKEVFLSLNSLIISYNIIVELNVYHTILKIIILMIFSYLLSQIMKKEVIFSVISILIFAKQILTNNIMFYFYDFVILLFILTLKNIYTKGIVKKALTRDVYKKDIKEGMILAYPLYYLNNEYYFDKTSFLSDFKNIISKKDKGKLVCGIKSSGLSLQDVHLIKNNLNQEVIQIKEGLSFAPFILVGLFITFSIGNTFDLIIMLVEMI